MIEGDRGWRSANTRSPPVPKRKRPEEKPQEQFEGFLEVVRDASPKSGGKRRGPKADVGLARVLFHVNQFRRLSGLRS